jgi:hypothetical protein
MPPLGRQQHGLERRSAFVFFFLLLYCRVYSGWVEGPLVLPRRVPGSTDHCGWTTARASGAAGLRRSPADCCCSSGGTILFREWNVKIIQPYCCCCCCCCPAGDSHKRSGPNCIIIAVSVCRRPLFSAVRGTTGPAHPFFRVRLCHWHLIHRTTVRKTCQIQRPDCGQNQAASDLIKH